MGLLAIPMEDLLAYAGHGGTRRGTQEPESNTSPFHRGAWNCLSPKSSSETLRCTVTMEPKIPDDPASWPIAGPVCRGAV
jgi:hypothetical protein